LICSRRTGDGIGARGVAIVAPDRDELSRLGADDRSVVLRLLFDRRDELTSERRRAIYAANPASGAVPAAFSAATVSRRPR
jgi:hypothetical protein